MVEDLVRRFEGFVCAEPIRRTSTTLRPPRADAHSGGAIIASGVRTAPITRRFVPPIEKAIGAAAAALSRLGCSPHHIGTTTKK